MNKNKAGVLIIASLAVGLAGISATYYSAASAKKSAANWESRASAADVELTVARVRIKELNDELAAERATSASLRATLDEQRAACVRDGKRLSDMDDELERAGFDSVGALLNHVYLHERQASNLVRWWRWEKRDAYACMCELGKRTRCDPTKVDYGGDWYGQFWWSTAAEEEAEDDDTVIPPH